MTKVVTKTVIKLIGAAILMAAVVLGGSPASAAPSLEFKNICGGVTVTTDAPAGTDIRITRHGKPAGGFALSGDTFSIAAHDGLRIGVSVGGAPEVIHTYADPDSCSNVGDLAATFDDWCFDRVFVQLLGEAHLTLPGFIVTVNGTPHTVPAGKAYHVADGVPDSAVLAVYRDLPGGERAFYAGHTYRKPTGCGVSGLSVRFVDNCYGVRAEVTNTASAIQTWTASHGQTVEPSRWGRPNTTTAQQISGLAEGAVVTLKLFAPPDTYTEFATHTYRKPAECASPWKTKVSFVDSCVGTSVTVTALGDIQEYWIDTGSERRRWIYLTLGESKTVEVPLQSGTVVVSRGGPMEGGGDRTIATHDYVKPALCGLPVTGASAARIAASGLLVVLLGVVTLVLARRRRLPR